MSTTLTSKGPKRTSPRRAASKKGPLAVMLVDDHPLWRDTLRKILEHQRFAVVVAEASDGEEAVAQAEMARPGLVVMDIQLPNRNGIEATRDLVAKQPDLKVLVLASSDDRTQVLAAVEAGACGYLLKTASSEEVREAVRRVHSGELVFPPKLADVVLGELRGRRPKTSAAPSAVSANAFEREGDYWTVRFEDRTFRLKNTRGARYLAELLHSPAREFHALDLVALDRGEGEMRRQGDAGPMLDAQAKATYRRRIEDLEEEVREAEAWGDKERASRADEELDALRAELASAVGLGGRDRRSASVSERARVNVTLAIRATLKKIKEYDASLATHLSHAVKTGTYCSYVPDPRAPIDWK